MNNLLPLVVATAILVMIPGPNVALIVANSLEYGFRVTASQLGLVAAVFLAVLFAGDVLWAAFASSAGRFLSRYATIRNRLTGTFLTAAGIGLAVSHR